MKKLFFIALSISLQWMVCTAQLPHADSILLVTKKVADWQLNSWKTNGVSRNKTNWTNAACYTGFTELNKVAKDPKYIKAIYEIGAAANWKTGLRRTFADDYAVGQVYAQLYLVYKEKEILSDFTKLSDSIATLPMNEPLKWGNNIQLRELAWCDALFMGPPSMAYLATAKKDRKYLDLADRIWWKTTDYLYNTKEHLFTRDSRYFAQREKNGANVYWARGNGWVIAGLVRMLENMPANYSNRPRYLKLYQEMVDKLVAIQHQDGTWHTALLDQESYPAKETSGTAFIAYAITWGINQKILDYQTYYPTVKKAWVALASSVHPDGLLGYVQKIDEKPGIVTYNDTEVYGVGAFLLAGTQLYILESHPIRAKAAKKKKQG